jgi:hypothetical protein
VHTIPKFAFGHEGDAVSCGPQALKHPTQL